MFWKSLSLKGAEGAGSDKTSMFASSKSSGFNPSVMGLVLETFLDFFDI